MELRTQVREKTRFFRSRKGRKALRASKAAGAPTDEVRRAVAELSAISAEHRQLARELQRKRLIGVARSIASSMRSLAMPTMKPGGPPAGGGPDSQGVKRR